MKCETPASVGNANSSADVLQANNKSNKISHYSANVRVFFQQVVGCIHVSAINYMSANVHVYVKSNRMGGHAFITLLFRGKQVFFYCVLNCLNVFVVVTKLL